MFGNAEAVADASARAVVFDLESVTGELVFQRDVADGARVGAVLVMAIPSAQDLGTPLFITSLALSLTNAIGVQVKNYSRLWAKPVWHCYWDTGTGLSSDSNSVLLKNSLPDRWPCSTGRGFITRQVEKMNLCWWKGNNLLPKRVAQLAQLFREANLAYVAPLSSRDALRCIEVLRVLRIPYVVHLWDIMDKQSLDGALPGYTQLLSGAQHIFCVSSPMEDDVRKISDKPTSLLSFTRPDASTRANPRGSELRLAISGHLAPYRHGLELLASALPLLQRAFPRLSIVYIGANEQAALLPEALRVIVTKTGFVEDATRDRLLAECHAGFLPGPLLDTSDARSRYSIPSRMGDYFSVGLPVVAAVYERSAVNLHFKALTGGGFQRVSTASELVSALTVMKEEGFWRQASQSSRTCFVETMSEQVVLGQLESVVARTLRSASLAPAPERYEWPA